MDKIKKIFKHGDKEEGEEVDHTPSPHAETAAKTALAGHGAGQSSTDSPVHLQTNPDAEKKEHGILSQITNPGGAKHDDTRYGETATAVPGTTLTRLKDEGGGSNISMASGVLGPYASNADPALPIASSTTAGTSNIGGTTESSSFPTGSSTLGQQSQTTEWPLASGSATSSQPHTDTSHLGRDAAVSGAAATGLGAAGLASSKDHDSISPSNTTSVGQQTTTSSVPISDVATSTIPDRSAQSTGASASLSPETGSLAGGRVQPDASGSQVSDTQSSSHLGRDAGIGAGVGAGALGAGALASHNKEHESLGSSTGERSFPLGGGTTQTGATSSTSPMSGGMTDPVGVVGAENPGTGVTPGTGLSSLATQTSSDPSSVRGLANQEVGTTSNSSHLGRDTAVVGAGAAAVSAGSLAAYEKEHEPKSDIAAATYTARSQPVGGSATDDGRGFLPASTTGVPPLGGHREDEKPVEGVVHHATGPHATDIANVLDPHVPGEFPTEEGLDRHGRNGLGAEAGTVGLTGAAATTAAIGLNDRSTTGTASSQTAVPSSPSTARHPSELMGMPADQTGAQPESDRHAVRHASISAGTAGVGAAGLGAAAYEANKRDQPSDIGFSSGSPPKNLASGNIASSSTSGAIPSTQTSRSAAPVAATAGTQQGFGSTTAPTHPSELMGRPADQQAQSESHTGRDAALGAGAGLGAAGLATAGYEAHKSHADPSLGSASQAQPGVLYQSGMPASSSAPQHGEQEPVIQTTTNHRLSQSSGSQAPLTTGQVGQQSTDQKEHHYGRDAAVAGGVGAGGLGAYEALKHHEKENQLPGATTSSAGPTTSSAIPTSTSAAAPSSLAADTSSLPTTSPTAAGTSGVDHRDVGIVGGTALGGAGLGEAAKHHEQSTNLPTTSSTTATSSATQPTEQNEHHYGRDAAVVGGVGAGGAGAYEAVKHHEKKEHGATSASTTHDDVQREHGKLLKKDDPRREDTDKKEHHHGKEAAAVGGAGAAGVGAYELGKHEKASDHDESSGHREHNKLHKRNDPRSDKYEPEEEKKPSLLKRILHPHSSKEKEHESSSSHDDDHHNKAAVPAAAAGVGAGAVAAEHHSSSHPAEGQVKDGIMIEPHTGLPMNVGKYGTEAVENRSGTDGPIGDATHVSDATHLSGTTPGDATHTSGAAAGTAAGGSALAGEHAHHTGEHGHHAAPPGDKHYAMDPETNKPIDKNTHHGHPTLTDSTLRGDAGMNDSNVSGGLNWSM